MARSMLSFGMEYERALATAAASAAFVSISGPPSRAARMIARESLVKSVQPPVGRELRMEGGHHDRPLAGGDRVAVEGRNRLDPLPHPLDPRRADEDAVHRQVLARDPDRGFEARHLAPVGVAAHLEVDQA